MKTLFKIILIVFPIYAFGQNGITFKTEDLSKPQRLLYSQPYENIYKNLIQKEVELSKWDIERSEIDFKYNILAKSQAPDSLVSFGYHSFFNGMYQAYADHRPFVLSPDMIWLLISQGFARHVNANPEKLRKYFVDFSGKSSLVVNSQRDLFKDDINWEEIFPQFTRYIAEHTGKELINTLTADFSTTTAVEKVASEITIMEAMEPYFEFVVMYAVCGIPEITLLGTTEDWQRVLDKTGKLSRYDLKWWTRELEPVLKEFVNASKGKIDKPFWRNMFKYHSQKQYGAPKIIDGWIVKFFPYDKDGKRNGLKELRGSNSLPEEMVKVDLKYIKTDGLQTEETMLELWAGFIGLAQNRETFALTPKISWMIKKKDVDQTGLYQKLESQNVPGSRLGSGIDLNVIEVPVVLSKFNEIYDLSLHFKKWISIPDWMKDIKIGKLKLDGKITPAEFSKITQWFPDTYLCINGISFNEGKNGWVKVSGNKIPDEVLSLKEIRVLEILNNIYKEDKFIIPEALKNTKIANLTLINETSSENIEKLMELLPETNIFINGKKIKKLH